MQFVSDWGRQGLSIKASFQGVRTGGHAAFCGSFFLPRGAARHESERALVVLQDLGAGASLPAPEQHGVLGWVGPSRHDLESVVCPCDQVNGWKCQIPFSAIPSACKISVESHRLLDCPVAVHFGLSMPLRCLQGHISTRTQRRCSTSRRRKPLSGPSAMCSTASPNPKTLWTPWARGRLPRDDVVVPR